jgi:hypothetical protein
MWTAVVLAAVGTLLVGLLALQFGIYLGGLVIPGHG